MFRFEDPQYLYLLAVVVLLALIRLITYRKQKQRLFRKRPIGPCRPAGKAGGDPFRRSGAGRYRYRRAEPGARRRSRPGFSDTDLR